jgi:tripartite-type tricarboxylate transporter receptor subunit TctC
VSKAIITQLNAAINKSLARPEVKQQLMNQGLEAVGGSPEEFAKFVRSEVVKMGKIIKASGAKPEGQ